MGIQLRLLSAHYLFCNFLCDTLESGIEWKESQIVCVKLQETSLTACSDDPAYNQAILLHSFLH